MTGVGSEEFALAVKGMLALHQVIRTHLGTTVLLDWSPSCENGNLVMEFANRYLSNASDAGKHQIMTFPTDLDPQGLLQQRISSEIYLSDNEVKYYERRKVVRGGHEYVYSTLYCISLQYALSSGRLRQM